jgi:hypothetical protein
VAKVVEASDPHAAWATMSVRTITNIFLYGLLVGVVTFALYLVLERFVFEPILCRESAALARCESKESIASGAAIVLASMLGLVLLVRERVYRPILAIIGVAVSLWGVFALVAGLPIVLAAVVSIILFSVSYVLFSWLVQPTSLVVSIVTVAVVAALARVAIG